MPLTETDIKAIKPKSTGHQWLNDGAGLYLRVAPSDRRTWIWRTKRRGKTSYFTIGEWPDLTIEQARAELAKRTGRATRPNALTVKDALEQWFGDQIEPRYSVVKNIRTYVDRSIAEFGARRLQELSRAEIARFLRVYAKDTPVARIGAWRHSSSLLAGVVEVGYLEHSPAEGLTRRVAGGEEESRSRVLLDAEIREIWHLESPNANLLRGLLLTGCRIAELQKAAHWHLQGDWLSIPAAHSKNRRAHRVYVVPEGTSGRMSDEFSALPSVHAEFNGRPPLLFRSVSPTAVQAWVRRLQLDVDGKPREQWFSIRPIDKETGEPMDAWTPHDLRRTFSTRLGDLGVAPHVIEKLLNHTPEGMAAIYNRAELLEERMAATKLWAAELARIVSG